MIAVLVIGSIIGYILVGLIVGSINQACSCDSFERNPVPFVVGLCLWPFVVAGALLFIVFWGPCALLYRSGRYLSGAMRDTTLVRLIKNR